MTTTGRDLDRAYRRARYRLCLGATSAELQIGTAQPAVADLLKRHAAAGGAWLTACNPLSRLCDESVNRTAQERLETRLIAAGHALYRGTALDPDGVWPPEPSVLVVGMRRDDAVALATELGQNALLWLHADGTPALVWTHHATAATG